MFWRRENLLPLPAFEPQLSGPDFITILIELLWFLSHVSVYLPKLFNGKKVISEEKHRELTKL
jgi:hypothetical protein